MADGIQALGEPQIQHGHHEGTKIFYPCWELSPQTPSP